MPEEDAPVAQEAASLRAQNAVLEYQRCSLTETQDWVKTNLQLITTMVELLTMGRSPEELQEELSHLSTHIRAITMIHELLIEDASTSRENLQLSVETVLGRLLPLVQQKKTGHPIYLQVQDVELPAHQCTSLAIITNELVSNAIKYSSHNVVVSFKVEGDKACLHVQDNGKGFPVDFDPTQESNTGLNLVSSLSEYDLGGEVVFDNHERGGARIRVFFPFQSV